MYTLFLFISIVVCVIAIKKCITLMHNDECEDGYLIVIIISGALSIFLLYKTIGNIEAIATAHAIDEKITMYEQENESIEQSIGTTVRAYMDYEKETYKELSNKDAMSLVYHYPELKADQLVQQQINLYIANNYQIKMLKERQIDLAKIRWQLYFGR